MSGAYDQALRAAAESRARHLGPTELRATDDALEGKLRQVQAALTGADGDQRRIAEVFVEAASLCLRKNRDYGSSFREAPALAPDVCAQDAVLVRIDDKDRRFANLAGKVASVPESRYETMLDSACYRLLWCVLERERLA